VALPGPPDPEPGMPWCCQGAARRPGPLQDCACHSSNQRFRSTGSDQAGPGAGPAGWAEARTAGL